MHHGVIAFVKKEHFLVILAETIQETTVNMFAIRVRVSLKCRRVYRAFTVIR